jgi:hypothetical protein
VSDSLPLFMMEDPLTVVFVEETGTLESLVGSVIVTSATIRRVV